MNAGKTTRKVVRRLDDVMNVAFRIVMFAVILCGIYVTADVIGVYGDAGAEKVRNYKPEVVTKESLREISGECVAWLELYGTTVDYPVMQGKTNYDYLNKDPFGEYSLSGSIFLDVRNSPDFSDDYNLVYGHHMTAGLMFGALTAYESEDYWKTHKKGRLETGDSKYDLEVVAFVRCDASDLEIFDVDGDFERKTEFVRKKRWYGNEIPRGSKILSLTTCKTPGSTTRTVVLCVMTETANDGSETESET